MNDWEVYILKCSDGTLYTGITTDLDRRMQQHNSGKGAKYTRGRGPISVVARLTGLDKSTALQVELFIKKCPKNMKVYGLELMKKLQSTSAI